LLLPLGDRSKEQTRADAERLGLPVARKTESQDICFVEGGDYRDILDRLTPEAAHDGEIRSTAGELVGTHGGVTNFTVGQRRGLPASTAGPRYVTRIDASTNTIVIGGPDELDVRSLIADELNLIRPERFAGGGVAVRAMTRYRSRLADGRADVGPDGTLALSFDEPQRAVTPGQLVALFDPNSDEVWGAATICETRV
jgi:tRNA-specific 2-thiouridylase